MSASGFFANPVMMAAVDSVMSRNARALDRDFCAAAGYPHRIMWASEVMAGDPEPETIVVEVAGPAFELPSHLDFLNGMRL